MAVAVVGLGKLGLPLALLLAEAGFDVIGVDTNPDHLGRIKTGESPHRERWLPEMLAEHGPNIDWRSDIADAAAADVVFIVVPTPSLPSGAFDVSAVENVARTVSQTSRYDVCPVLCVVSTTNPGDCARIAENGLQPLVYSPEFVALGDVFATMRRPDLLLVGEHDKTAGNRVLSYLRAIRPGRPDDLPAGQTYLPAAPAIHRLTPTEAEIAKLSLNVALTVKIALANTIGALAAAMDGRPSLVADAVGADHRIGRAFLSPGPPPAGPCLPRDGHTFVHASDGAGLMSPLVAGVQAQNEYQRCRILDLVESVTPSGGYVTLLGMTYKPGTEVDDEAIGPWLAKQLPPDGYSTIEFGIPVQHLVDAGDTIVLCTDDPAWCSLDYTDRTVVDLWGLPINTTGVVRYVGPS